jgi:hypothetical protein
MKSPMTVKKPDPTAWFQKEAMSGEVDKLRRPLPAKGDEDTRQTGL